MFSAPLFDEGLFFADVDLADVRRERISLPLLRDERPELVAREWRRLIAERSGLAHDATAEPGARDGFDVAATSRRAAQARDVVVTAAGTDRSRGRAMTDAAAMFVLPDELAIDTDVARRVIADFIRGQLRQAGFERAVLGLSGGIDSALVAYLVAEAIGRRAAAVRADAVPDVLAGLARGRRGGRAPARLRVGAGRHLADGRRVLRGRRRARRGGRRRASRRRRSGGATSWPGCG